MKALEKGASNLKKQVEWQRMEANLWEGFKYFVLSKKLPGTELRRDLRQELERLNAGIAAFFTEAQKYGLEPDDSLERLRASDGKPLPSNEEFKRLDEACPSFGITRLEFDSGKKLTARLKQLLGE